jgi:hypothetical protein
MLGYLLSKIDGKSYLFQFVFTYFRKSGFSTLYQIKSKQRNRLDVENYMHYALSKISPWIMDLMDHR